MYKITWLLFFSSILGISASQAEIVSGTSPGNYIVRDATSSDFSKIAKIVLDYVKSNNIGLLFLGELHGQDNATKAEIQIASDLSKNAGFDCLSFEKGSVDASKPLYFALNQRNLSKLEWKNIFLSHWEYLCQLLDVRFKYNGECFKKEVFSKEGDFFFEFSRKTSLSFFGHELALVDFHNLIYNVQFKDPDEDKFGKYHTPLSWEAHYVKRNAGHTKNIVNNFKEGNCRRMIIIEGFRHLDHDHSLRMSIAPPESQSEFSKWKPTTPIQETVGKELNLRTAVVVFSSKKNHISIETEDLSFIFE